MTKITAIIVAVLMFIPSWVDGSTVVSPKEETILSVAEWESQYEELDLEREEDFSVESVNYRIAVELQDLRDNIRNLAKVEEKSGWINSLRLSWLEHKVGVQIRRITMLVRSSEKRQAITSEFATELLEYLELIKAEVREL